MHILSPSNSEAHSVFAYVRVFTMFPISVTLAQHLLFLFTVVIYIIVSILYCNN